MKNIIKTVLISVLITLAVGCQGNPSTEGLDCIEVKLHHDYADDVYLVCAHGYVIDELLMDRVSNGVYKLYVTLPEDENILLNISLRSDDYPDAVLWVGKPSGIDAVEVRINDIVLTSEYLVLTDDYPSSAFSICTKDDTITFAGGEQMDFDPRIPPELPQFFEYCRLQLPPEGFSTVLPWFQALQLYGEDEESTVEIEYARVYAHLPTGDILLYEDTYDEENEYKGFEHGGLYIRYPLLYDESNNTWSMPAKTENGSLIITPSTYSDRVFHWWMPTRCEVPEDAEYIRMEAKIRITGPACVQAGMDFWKDAYAPYEGLDVNNTEAALSDVFFDTGDWQIIDFSTEEISLWEY